MIDLDAIRARNESGMRVLDYLTQYVSENDCLGAAQAIRDRNDLLAHVDELIAKYDELARASKTLLDTEKRLDDARRRLK